MDDRRALMSATLANPDEDTPRYAFADWLDEHGDEAHDADANALLANPALAKLSKLVMYGMNWAFRGCRRRSKTNSASGSATTR